MAGPRPPTSRGLGTGPRTRRGSAPADGRPAGAAEHFGLLLGAAATIVFEGRSCVLGREWSAPERALEVHLALRLQRLSGVPYPGPVHSAVPTRLPAAEWTALAQAHADRADALTAGRRARRATGTRHPVEDFLHEYYSARPAQLRRWHPGAGVTLTPGARGPAPHASWRWYATGDDGAVTLDRNAFLADRGDTVAFVARLLAATAARPAHTGCFGLHEWAMVYRAEGHRHPLPLRLGQAGTDAVVEAHPVRCSHFDAFRFFTPAAVGRNRLQPTRASQVRLEQPGCLHATMDLYKWAYKLGPAVPGDLLLDCFVLAADVRALDMRASPYDLRDAGYEPVAIETPEGKVEYVAAQGEFARRGALLRRRLIDSCERLSPSTVPGRRDG